MTPPPSHNSHPPRFSDPPEEPALEAVEEEAPIPTSRVKDDSEMDITPMIDMTFLLLIFFIVCSKMDPGAAITLPPARHGEPVATKDAIVFTIAGSETEAVIYKGKGINPGEQLNGSSPVEKEAAAAAYVEERLAGNPNIKDVLIMADSGVKHRDVALVMKAVGSVETEGNQLHVAVMETR
jgi:biopolymer transport protein ExbD